MAMSRAFGRAMVGVAAIAAAATGQSSSCVMPTDGTHPAVDLNGLLNTTGDYTVLSGANPAYEFHFNVCGQTAFQDATCAEGATVCEIKDGSALDVYGYLDTISLEWEDTYLVMSQTGEAECPFNKAQPYTSKIWFLCAHDAAPIITLKAEAYYQCNLEFEFHTPQACGGQEVRYTCDDVNHQCVADAAGTYPSHGDCSEHCHPAPPPPAPPAPPAPPSGPRYSCFSNFSCHEVEGGAFSDPTSCQSTCQPFVRTYSCYQDRCVPDTRGIYKGESSCLAACSPPTEERWTCGADYTCTEDGFGPFATEGDCEAGCADPAATKYHCDAAQGVCVEAADGIADRTLCDSACAAGDAQTAKGKDASFDQAVARHVVRGRVV